MAQLVRRTWGLEVGMIRSNRSSLFAVPIEYGVVAVAGTTCGTLLHRLGTQFFNIAARRIAGVARAARAAVLELLHVVADVIPSRKPFVLCS